MGVIRWFQLQPRTRVALNTGRPESMRELTLGSLNALGALFRVVKIPVLAAAAGHGLGPGNPLKVETRVRTPLGQRAQSPRSGDVADLRSHFGHDAYLIVGCAMRLSSSSR